MPGANFMGGAFGKIHGFTRDYLSGMRASSQVIAESMAKSDKGLVRAAGAATYGNMAAMSNKGVAAYVGGVGAVGMTSTLMAYHKKSQETPDTPVINAMGAYLVNGTIGANVAAGAALGGFGLYRHLMKK